MEGRKYLSLSPHVDRVGGVGQLRVYTVRKYAHVNVSLRVRKVEDKTGRNAHSKYVPVFDGWGTLLSSFLVNGLWCHADYLRW